jgi:hypothetical protein
MESRQEAGDGSAPLPPPWGPSPTADDTNAPLILGVAGLMMGLSFTIVALRIWVRQVVIKTMGVDDSVMIAALVCSGFSGFRLGETGGRTVSLSFQGCVSACVCACVCG